MISASIVDGDCPIGQTCMFSISQLNDSHIAECGYFNNSVCYPGEINISVEETCSASCIFNENQIIPKNISIGNSGAIILNSTLCFQEEHWTLFKSDGSTIIIGSEGKLG